MCGICNHPPMGIRDFRRHMMEMHDKRCSWSGHVVTDSSTAGADCSRKNDDERCRPVQAGAAPGLGTGAESVTSGLSLHTPVNEEVNRRHLRCCRIRFNYVTNKIMEIAADKRRRLRRNREKGPWVCSDCSMPPMGDITTYRRHIVLKHDKHCSWSGHVRPFKDLDERQHMVDIIARAGQHRRAAKPSSTKPSPPTDLTVDNRASFLP